VFLDITIQKQASCKKVCGLCCEKDMKLKVAAKNGYDGRLMAKVLIMTIQLNLFSLLHFSIELSTKFT